MSGEVFQISCKKNASLLRLLIFVRHPNLLARGLPLLRYVNWERTKRTSFPSHSENSIICAARRIDLSQSGNFVQGKNARCNAIIFGSPGNHAKWIVNSVSNAFEMELTSLRSSSFKKLQNLLPNAFGWLSEISYFGKFWTVWRKVIQVQPLSCPLLPFAVHGFALVNGSIIDNHNAWT